MLLAQLRFDLKHLKNIGTILILKTKSISCIWIAWKLNKYPVFFPFNYTDLSGEFKTERTC